MPTPNPRPEIDKFTVVEQVYYQAFNEEPDQITSQFSYSLKTRDEQIYSRRKKVGEEWEPIDLGHLVDNGGEGCSNLIIQNNEGTFNDKAPTEEQTKDALKKILEVKHKDDKHPWLILPTTSVRFTPSDSKNLVIRSQFGIAKFTLNAIPK